MTIKRLNEIVHSYEDSKNINWLSHKYNLEFNLYKHHGSMFGGWNLFVEFYQIETEAYNPKVSIYCFDDIVSVVFDIPFNNEDQLIYIMDTVSKEIDWKSSLTSVFGALNRLINQ